MEFTFHQEDWQTIEQGEKDCYLLTNGLGGYSGLSIIGSAARGDQALLMAAKKAPNVRWHLITNVFEKLVVDKTEYILTSQRMKSGEDYQGFQYLQEFVHNDFDRESLQWKFLAGGVVLRKTILMPHGENTVAIKYEAENIEGKQVRLEVTPLLRFSTKKDIFDKEQTILFEHSNNRQECHKIIANEYTVYLSTNAEVLQQEGHLFGEMYFSQDERDGREAYGDAYMNHSIVFDFKQNGTSDKYCGSMVFSTQPIPYTEDIYNTLLDKVNMYKEMLLRQAAVTSELGKQLVLSADAYVVNRDSTNGKSIIAGYPFFEDWGRDTMIALAGTTMVTGRFTDCKSILRTFAKYVKNGLLPNLFPEGDANPMYNSADAPLLFINAVYEYMEYANDYDFQAEIVPVLEPIVENYQKGTDFHIQMDNDGLIMAGAELEQLTWMDVRVGDFLPTPRHGKPVEINAYWYSALRIMEKLTGKPSYGALAEKVQASFTEKFWNLEEQCLKDVLSGSSDENQIRCNQIWALSMPFTMLSAEKEELVIQKVRKELYTTIGLRTLSKKDKDFHGIYIGEMEKRDRAYHQGTVWAFPLGAYYRACIRLMKKSQDTQSMAYKQMQKELEDGFENLKLWLKEGCIAQIAEIYDGDTPTVSRGCFAQAWSVGELLRAVYDYEQFMK